MSNYEIREPKQERAKIKKQNIIHASYLLFCEQGYYRTNTVEIAKKANVSTGIVYSYFKNKKDILIEVIKSYINELTINFQLILKNNSNINSFHTIMDSIIDTLIQTHVMNIKAHNEFMAISYLENDVAKLFSEFEDTILELFTTFLLTKNINENHLKEKIMICYNMIEQLCHNYIYGKIPSTSLPIMKEMTINTIISLLEKNY